MASIGGGGQVEDQQIFAIITDTNKVPGRFGLNNNLNFKLTMKVK